MQRILNNIKTYLETIPITPTSWLLGVSGVLMVRFFLESFSSFNASGFFASDASTLIHYYLFFIGGLFALMLILKVFIPNWKNIIPQFTAITLPAIFIPPIVDLIVSGGKGFKTTYFFDMPEEIFSSFLNFGSSGVTIGLRIEILIVLLCLGVFVYLVQKSFIRAILAPIVVYAMVFVFASLPSFISFLAQVKSLFVVEPVVFFGQAMSESLTLANNLHGSLDYGSAYRVYEIGFNFVMGKVLFLISSILVALWFYLNFKPKFIAVFRNSRKERAAHYILTIFIGIIFAYFKFYPLELNWTDWLSVLTLCLAFYFAGMFSICTNDLVDEGIDKISNQERPLVSGVLSREEMKQASIIFLVASLIAAFLSGYTAFFFVITFISLYYVYSVPPTRFKIIPLFSSFIIGLCYSTTALAGFFLVSPLKIVSAFPIKLFVAVVVIITFLSHARDIKDIKGDKAFGINTVPVLLGDVWGPRVVGLFTGFSFILVPLFSGLNMLYLSAVPASIFSYYYVNKKPYTEKPLFVTYFLFVLVSVLLLLFNLEFNM
ncbi:MAG: UbiA family prenyltransferase [Parcubacteria group bacterium]|nr:UbiA family prenyltransferase [Parcubacteria group bacterium]